MAPLISRPSASLTGTPFGQQSLYETKLGGSTADFWASIPQRYQGGQPKSEEYIGRLGAFRTDVTLWPSSDNVAVIDKCWIVRQLGKECMSNVCKACVKDACLRGT